MNSQFPKTAFVIFPSGAFGGAEKRFTNLFISLQKLHPGKFYYIINPLMKKHLGRSFPGFNDSNIRVINTAAQEKSAGSQSPLPEKYNDTTPDPAETDKNASAARKYFWYYKNKSRQKKLFRQIEAIRKQEDIKVLIGIFAGGLPLVFYKENNIPGVKIIFSDMDSWFTEVLPDTKKLWYRKYYSFNNILQSADKVDFLSPYIASGVKKLGVTIPEEKISIAPCSFIDYSKCAAGLKDPFEVAFASRLEPDKNPMLYLNAAREILREFPNVKFHLLGEGSLVNEIAEFITAAGIKENVNFTFHNNPPEVFSRTSVFVSLQTGTNYPSQSVLEAMACGNAVIASNRGDTGLFINNANGVLVELNTGEVAAALRKMILNREGTSLLGKQAAEFVRQYHTIEKVTEYYTGLITGVYEGGFIG